MIVNGSVCEPLNVFSAGGIHSSIRLLTEASHGHRQRHGSRNRICCGEVHCISDAIQYRRGGLRSSCHIQYLHSPTEILKFLCHVGEVFMCIMNRTLLKNSEGVFS